MLERLFKLKANQTTVANELLAGITTFLMVIYTVVVSPSVLASAGMDFNSVFVATCIVAAIGSTLMGITTNYPAIISANVSISAYFAFTVVMATGISWQAALGAVFIAGILFLLAGSSNFSVWLIQEIPASLRVSISAGVGVFMMLIALKDADIIAIHPATLLTLGDITQPKSILVFLGFIIITTLEYHRVPGAIIIGIFVITLLSFLLDLQHLNVEFKHSENMLNGLMSMDMNNILPSTLIAVSIVFFISHLFNSAGGFISVLSQLEPERHHNKLLKRGFLVNAWMMLIGALSGSANSVIAAESALGAKVGGKTGLTAVTVGLLFLGSIWLAPFVASIPRYAIAPALCYLAILMIRGLGDINWQDVTEAVPAVVTALTMGFTASIVDGIAFGCIVHTIVKLFTVKYEDLSLPVVLIIALWILKFLVT